MTHKVYIGHYRIGGPYFTCKVVAKSFEQAQDFADSWNVGAIIEGALDDSPHVPMPGDEGFPHWLIYISWLAMNAGIFKTEWFADNGIIHDLLHRHEGLGYVGDDPMPAYRKLCKDLHLLP